MTMKLTDRSDNEPGYDDVSLQDLSSVQSENLQPIESDSSDQHLIPSSILLSEQRGSHSRVHEGARQLFIGRRSNTEAVRRSHIISIGSNLLNKSKTLSKHENKDSDGLTTSFGDDLKNPSRLDDIKAGLNDALGVYGSWLSGEGNSSTSSQHHLSDSHLPGPSALRNSAKSDYSNLDSVSLAEEGIRSQSAAPSNTVGNVFRNLSARVAADTLEYETSFRGHQSLSSLRHSSEAERRHMLPRMSTDSMESLNDDGEIDINRSVFRFADDSVSDTQNYLSGQEHLNPRLFGKSLKIFDHNSKWRNRLYKILYQNWVEPAVFSLILLQTIIISYITAPNIFIERSNGPLFLSWGHSWTDWVLLIIFIIYTAEVGSKIIVFGLWDDSHLFVEEMQTSSFQINKSFLNFFQKDKYKVESDSKEIPVIIRTVTTFVTGKSTSDENTVLNQAHMHRAYLRGSWNRVDFVSTVSFWISLALNLTGFESNNQFFLFRVVSSIRILRLLNLTHGTSSVLRSLKKAAPLLTNVSFFIAFFWWVMNESVSFKNEANLV